VIAPASHPLARRTSLKLAELLDVDFVGLHVGAAAQDIILAEAAAQGRSLKARLQVRGFDAIAQLVAAGLGVAIMPTGVAQRLSQAYAIGLVALDERWARRDYLVAVRAQEVLPAVTRRFVDLLRQGAPARVDTALSDDVARAASDLPSSRTSPSFD